MKYKKLIGMLSILFFLTPNVKVLASEDTKSTDAELYWGEKQMEGKLQEGLTHNFDGLFLDGESMMPGDSVERCMTLKNTYKYPYTISLTGTRNMEECDKQYDLLEKINLDLFIIDSEGKENEVYSGPIFEGNKCKANIELCTLQPKEQATLKAVATLDGQNTTKEYMGKKASVDWVFSVEGDEKNSTNKSDEAPKDSTKPDDKSNPVTPSNTNPISTSTYNGSTPLGKGLAKTGDTTNMTVILVLAVGNLIVGTLLFKKRKVNKEE
ncbi:MAG: hypothetical protein E7214_08150 [Clostridium sp.]|nr:hypothetical protein [Clostridium sp.]